MIWRSVNGAKFGWKMYKTMSKSIIATEMAIFN